MGGGLCGWEGRLGDRSKRGPEFLVGGVTRTGVISYSIREKLTGDPNMQIQPTSN